MEIIDLRSDTVTKPSRGMLEAMMQANVGDDVYGEDPTTNELQKMCAGLFGYEAALFCPSGTMANQIAIKNHTRPGDEVICGDLSHVYHYEGGGIGFNSAASIKLIAGDRGRFVADQLLENIHDPDDYHHPISRLVVAENTCNKGGGSVWNYEELKKIGDTAHSHGLMFHLDGARLFNAMKVDNSKPEDYGAIFDSISICLSKGLGAPIGSVLMGNRLFIKQAIRTRKLFGGAMRQSGFLAAAGIYALKNNINRLTADHDNAAKLGKALAACSWVDSVEPVETNIVIFKLSSFVDELEFFSKFRESGVLCSKFGPSIVRLVTHLDVDEIMTERVCEIIRCLEF